MSIATHCSFLLFNGELGAMQHRLSVIRTILHHLISIRVDLRLQFPSITWARQRSVPVSYSCGVAIDSEAAGLMFRGGTTRGGLERLEAVSPNRHA